MSSIRNLLTSSTVAPTALKCHPFRFAERFRILVANSFVVQSRAHAVTAVDAPLCSDKA
ncbi:hypothetical protein BV25DRAFT_1824492 [Artomyces pyxidatus]|uniref:Uncharacterized protein n=1 Tax=Artomyces pyxidatus TaxID=48021 RepID=A0ACB8T5H7_9AGAM|nr:hypothetical protein BV25DRAFT_1824492 [Artomyces pyxidatus]